MIPNRVPRAARWVLGLATVVVSVGLDAGASAQEKRVAHPNLLTGAGEWLPRPRIVIDPLLPTGAAIVGEPRPTPSAIPGCDPVVPVCVQRSAGVDDADAARFLDATVWAYRSVVHALGLPAPLPDGGAGGSPAFDLYLVDSANEAEARGEPIPGSRFDRAASYCVVGARSSASARRAALRCLAEATLYRLDSAETPALRRAFATNLGSLLGEVGLSDIEALDDAQANPHIAVASREIGPGTAAHAMLLDFLDRRLGSTRLGILPAAIASLSAGRTSVGRWQWDNEPDWFDVFRETFETPREWAELLGDFAVDRAFVGDRDDRGRFPTLAGVGSFGAVRVEWRLPYSTLPRRVAPLRPVEPTGSTYVWVDLDEVPLTATLGFRAEWEAPVAFKWTLLTLDREGREVARHDVPFQERSTKAEATLINFQTAGALLVVGTNIGGVDASHPFDPDAEPWEPHGYTVYLANL